MRKKTTRYHIFMWMVMLLLTLVFVPSISAKASGWVDIAENIKLNKWYSDMLEDSDYYEKASVSGGEYYDAYKFKVKKKGILKIKMRAEKGFDHRVWIYKSSNVDEPIFTDVADLKRSSGNGDYFDYDSMKTSLKKGQYYLVIHTDSFQLQDSEYSFRLSMK